MSDTGKNFRQQARTAALTALRRAMIEGTMWHYDDLVAAAHAAGVSDEDLELVAHEAVRALLAGAEEPLTPRDLTPTGRKKP